MNVDTNKYYNYRKNMLGKYVDRDDACSELNSKGINVNPYGTFK